MNECTISYEPEAPESDRRVVLDGLVAYGDDRTDSPRRYTPVTVLLRDTGGAPAAFAPDSASAAQVCGCKRNTNGRVRRITASAPLTCRPNQTLVCWNEDPPPGDISVRVFRSSNQSIPDFIDTAVSFDSERWDTDNIHDPATPNRLTANTAGKYYIFGNLSYEPNSNGTRDMYIRLSGSTLIAVVRHAPFPATPGPAGETIMSVSAHYDLAAGDYAELVASQISGASLDVVAHGDYSPEFGMVKLP